MGDVMSDGGTVYLESGIPESVRDELRSMGHDIATRKTVYGGYQAILKDDVQGVYYGASESRKDGQAAGY
jgi:gamma-glutamyltranspeptidase/glutathione hydrolase